MDAYRQLRAEEIVSTLERLHARIGERFPGSGLSRVAEQVLAVARENAVQVQALKRSNPWFRGAIWLLLALAAALAVWTTFELASGRRNWIPDSGSELIQEVEAALGLVVYLGAALLFLLTLDSRWRRRRALRAIHELRSLAHIVDMHQLTKAPERLLRRLPPTASSPGAAQQISDPFLLGRYLDYCSELLALIAKIGALYAESLDDPAAVAAVDEIEDLTNGLSNKIWQKLIVLDHVADEQARGGATGHAT